MELGLFRRQRGPLAQSTPQRPGPPSCLLASGEITGESGASRLGWFQPSMASHVSQQPWVVS